MKILGINVSKRAIENRLSILASVAKRRAVISAYLAEEAEPKLQIGGGTNILQGWLNSDLMPSKGVIHIDATRKLPFPDTSFKYLFSEHMIEHLPVTDAASFLAECCRVLMPGGTLRISTPDFQFVQRLWTEAKDEVIQNYCQFAVTTFVEFPKIVNPCVVANNFFSNWGHRFIFDQETLSYLLKEAGFNSVKREEVGKSAHEPLRNVERHHKAIGDKFNRFETMALEAVK